jgi:ribosomal protein S18 acetylase RimI-like enzyme
MMNEIDFTIRTASDSDRSRLANLIHFGSYIHQHLDWKPPLDWIGRKPYLLIEKNGSLLATLACPPNLPDITWIRLFAASSNITIDNAWRYLWDATLEELSQFGRIKVVALSLQSWFNELLEVSYFDHTDNVIVLLWESGTPMQEPKPIDVTIRSMIPEDLGTVMNIDNSAFGLEWRNSMDELELAFQQSSLASVAEMGDEIVGYQYSTSSALGGHLARLAVSPSMQGKGIGYILVHDVLQQLRKKGIMHITVNTQQNNETSLALYLKAGFKSTGESYRVYQYISKPGGNI